MTGKTKKPFYTFDKADGVIGETEYICSVALVDFKNFKMGAYSYPAIITTLETTH